MARWGQARVETIAFYQEIKSELARGVPVKQVYQALVERGHVTVTYNSFRRQVQAVRNEININPIEQLATLNTFEEEQADIPSKKKNIIQIDPPPSHLNSLSSSSTERNDEPKQGFKFNPVSKVEDFF